MQINSAPLSGLMILEPQIFNDERGYFFEMVQHHRYAKYGMPAFLQANISRSKKNVLRGLHYQLPHAQGKLIGVIRGSVWDVVVDIRRSSPTFAQWFSIELNDQNHLQMYIPPGFAHGFCVLSDEADFYYHCTDLYEPKSEKGILWNDPQLNISWPITQPILSAKDQIYPQLCGISHEHLFA